MPAPPLLDPDADLRRDLARHKAFATGLLVLMAVLIAVGYTLPPGYWAELLQSSAKAGFIGGIADWFAVTAIFRHPLGLPIPHTAIIPRQKARLGAGAGAVRGRARDHAVGGQPRAEPARHLGDPGALPQRPRGSAAGGAGADGDAAAHPLHRGGRAGAAHHGADRAAAAGRAQHRGRGGAGAAHHGRGRAAPGCDDLPDGAVPHAAGGQARPAARVHREQGAQPGRPPGRLGAGRAGRQPRAGRAARRAGPCRPARQRHPRRVRRMGAPRARPHGARPGARRRDRRRHPPRDGARDGAGLAVGRLGPAAPRHRGRRRPPQRPHHGRDRGRAGQSRRLPGRGSGRAGQAAARRRERGREPAAERADAALRLHRRGRGQLGTRRPSPTSWSCALAATCSSFG